MYRSFEALPLKKSFLDTELERVEEKEQQKKQKQDQEQDQEQEYENKWVHYSFTEGFEFMKFRRAVVMAIAIARQNNAPLQYEGPPSTIWENTPIGSEESFIQKCKIDDDFERGYAALVDSKDNQSSEIAKALQRMDRELPVIGYSYPMFVTEPIDFLKTYSVLSVGIIGSKKSLPAKTSKLQTSNNEDNARHWQHTIETILGTSEVFQEKCKAELVTFPNTTPYHAFWSNVAYQIIKTNIDPYSEELRLRVFKGKNGNLRGLKSSTQAEPSWKKTRERHSYVIKALKKGEDISILKFK